MIPHRGEQDPVAAPVDSAVVIEHGDLCYLNTDDVRPAGYDANADGTGELWATSENVTQLAFKEVFLGVALQASRSGDTDEIQVATEGIFLFDCASATFEIGDYVCPAKTSGNNLENQKVKKTLEHEIAIGRVWKRGTSVTKVWVRILSTVMHGGVHADVGS
jgi:hypothetical protein